MSLVRTLFDFKPLRSAIAAGALLRGGIYLLLGSRYRGIKDLCWVYRVAGIGLYRRIAIRAIKKSALSASAAGSNEILDSFLRSRFASSAARKYVQSGNGGSNDLFRDVMVLKKQDKAEKGVIIIKYAKTFEAFLSFFDMDRVSERFFIVLEPCWAGYCDPSILMFVSPGRRVFVQCFTDDDFDFISGFSPSLVPIRMGPADWVDSDLFKPLPVLEKDYDFVMVANWARHKRHDALFKALKRIKDRRMKVLLIGFNWGGRTTADMERLASGVNNRFVEIEIKENLKQSEVCEYLSRSKAYVFLSWKEGDNKALVEAMFAGLPAIVYRHSIGGAVNRINSRTGILTTYEELDRNLLYMLDNYRRFTPREWAVANTGSRISTGRLDGLIRKTALECGERYEKAIAEKTNSPNLAYRDPGMLGHFADEYAFLRRSFRDRWSGRSPNSRSGSRGRTEQERSAERT